MRRLLVLLLLLQLVPGLLQDKINFQIMGTIRWHNDSAASLPLAG